MDWASVFDKAYHQPGATEDDIAQFVTEIRRPMSAAEIREVKVSQQNPYPKTDPLHARWRTFDAAAWVIPDRPLPPSYLALLRWSDGGEFCTGERWFQFFPALDPRHGVRAMLLAYHLPQHMPGALPVAFNGSGTFYLLDMRCAATGGEYPVVCAQADCLGWEPEECCLVGDSLVGACRGTGNVDDLLSGLAEQFAARDRGRHPGSARHEGQAGGPGT
jgi:hypothetical protein